MNELQKKLSMVFLIVIVGLLGITIMFSKYYYYYGMNTLCSNQNAVLTKINKTFTCMDKEEFAFKQSQAQQGDLNYQEFYDNITIEGLK